MDSITQDMKYRYSLMKYAEKYGVSRASRKYDKSRSYIYFWRKRFDGTIESLACRSRRPHSHPNQHTPEEMKLIQKMRRRNPKLGIVELWARLRSRGYSRCVESLWRVLRREGLLPEEAPKKKYTPKPYEQMQYPGQRVQIDVKVVPRKCIADPELKLFQYTAIDEYSRYRVLGAYPEQSTYSSADFLRKVVKVFARKGIKVECVQTDNGFEFTNRFSPSKREIKTLFEQTAFDLGIRHKLIRPYTPRHNGKVERSHREDQKRFYDSHRFYSLTDFGGQLAAHQSRSNSRPMRPLFWRFALQTLSSKDGWRYYRTRFKVGEDFYVGIINVKPSERGWLMHDVTQIQKSRQATLSSSGKTASSDTHVSNDSISDSGEKFNEKFSLKEDSDFEYDEDSNLTSFPVQYV